MSSCLSVIPDLPGHARVRIIRDPVLGLLEIDVATRLMARPPSSSSNANLTLIIRALAYDKLGDERAARADVNEAVRRFPRRTTAAWTRQRAYAEPNLQQDWAARLAALGMP